MRARSLGCLAVAAHVLAAALAPPARAIDVLAFGDSLTFGIGDEEGLGYPKRLKKLLGKGSTVANRGVPGEETALGLSRLGAVLDEGGDVLLLMEGTNDLTLVAEGLLSIETTLANIDAMVTRTREAELEPVLASIVPRSPTAKRDRGNNVTSYFAGALRELASQRDLRFADPYDIFDPLTNPDYFVEYFDKNPFDTVGHLNGQGYDRLAAAFGDLLEGVDTAPPVIGNFEPGPLPNRVPTSVTIKVPVYDFKSGAGLDLAETKLLLNGKVVADGTGSHGDETKVELKHRGEETFGCRAVLRVLAQDLAVPPNTLDRTIAIYDVAGRTVLQGDSDFDCRVEGADLVHFALRFGLDSSDPGYQVAWDFDRDGMIDDTDLAILSGNFGKSSR